MQHTVWETVPPFVIYNVAAKFGRRGENQQTELHMVLVQKGLYVILEITH